jgi:hypothetical protein
MKQHIAHIATLFLPALMPSWRFFESIAPSPRIEYAICASDAIAPSAWHEFRPRPQSVSFLQMLWRLIYNPQWNEHLYLTSCAERLMQVADDRYSAAEIMRRIQADLRGERGRQYLRFRVAFISREEAGLETHILYESAPEPINGNGGEQ